ncbi:MAG: hypothetical protein LBP52_05310 [Burkholderiaceae bacterium]|nr:hypothetical protein [Burkholderiaceae bacterium]
MPLLTEPVLFTGPDGRARFRDAPLLLPEGTPAARLSALMGTAGAQWRWSPAGFASDFHCTGTLQWLVVLGGRMEIGLRDGTARVFGPGEFFYSSDTLPAGQCFDPQVHGHRSRALDGMPLMTLFVRSAMPGARG